MTKPPNPQPCGSCVTHSNLAPAMRLHLVDSSSILVRAWAASFTPFPEVTVQQGDLLAVAKTCVVSPANSYGFMDGGIDADYRKFFGPQIERTVQEAIAGRPEGYLPVGASLIVRTGHPRVPFLIVAPTMAMPERVERENCYRAMRAILRIVNSNAQVGTDVYCPGLGTGVGGVPPSEAASAMAKAYAEWKQTLSTHIPPTP